MKKVTCFILALAASLTALAGNAAVCGLKSYLSEDQTGVSFSWRMEASGNGVIQKAYRIRVAESLKDLKRGKNLVWDSGEILSDISVHVPGGFVPQPRKDYFWDVTVSASGCGIVRSQPDAFMTSLPRDGWKAFWIGMGSRDDIVFEAVNAKRSRTTLPGRYLRKTFDAGCGIRRARLYVCGLGSSYCYINGQEVGNDIFGPLPRMYTVSADYLTYDVTGLIRKGSNAIGVALGNGRYTGMRTRDNMLFGVPRLLLQLEIEYRNGRTQTIISDGSWSVTDKGPITKNNEFDGETYDANFELGAWTSPGYDETPAWKKAEIMDAPGGILRPQTAPCLKIHEVIKPVSVRKTDDGRIILDMGQNMVGWLQVRLTGHKGTCVSMRYAEVLQKDNNDQLYVDNLRSAFNRDEYIPAEDGPFSWHPLFVYHGFRFVEISGLDYLPSVDDFDGCVIYDDMDTIGSFECSDEIISAIHRNSYWGIRGNYRGMPTDCPQRDERMPWLGDRATGCYGESFIFDNERLYDKWMLDIEESMDGKGCISDVSPAYEVFYHGDVTWPSVFIYATDMLYRHFGNTDAVKSRYPAMKKWVQFILDTHFKDGIVEYDQYGDWCLPPEEQTLIHSKDKSRMTPGPILSTSVFYDLILKMKTFAEVCNLPEDAARYDSLAREIHAAYNAKFFNAGEGFYGNNTVTANIMSLDIGLVPEEHQGRVMANAVDKTENLWNGHVSAGVLGTQHLMRGLTGFGQKDLAFRIAASDTYPSWGYMIRQGATTIWELWNGDTANPRMNSRNHVMLLGDLIIWMYEDLAGIKCAPDALAYKKLLMKPVIPSGLDHVNASLNTPYGMVSSEWRKEGSTFEWTVSIPANTTACLQFPDSTSTTVTSGRHNFKLNIPDWEGN